MGVVGFGWLVWLVVGWFDGLARYSVCDSLLAYLLLVVVFVGHNIHKMAGRGWFVKAVVGHGVGRDVVGEAVVGRLTVSVSSVVLLVVVVLGRDGWTVVVVVGCCRCWLVCRLGVFLCCWSWSSVGVVSCEIAFQRN